MIEVTKENVKSIPFYAGSKRNMDDDAKLVESMLDDLEDMNMKLIEKGMDYIVLRLMMQDTHDEWSCERTDPCPDHYGCFYIDVEGYADHIGDPMTIGELDNALLILYDFINMV